MSESYNLLLQPCGIFRDDPLPHSCRMISDNVHGGPYYTQRGSHKGLLGIRSRRDIPLPIVVAAWECAVFVAKSGTDDVVACFTAITIAAWQRETRECRSSETQLDLITQKKNAITLNKPWNPWNKPVHNISTVWCNWATLYPKIRRWLKNFRSLTLLHLIAF